GSRALDSARCLAVSGPAEPRPDAGSRVPGSAHCPAVSGPAGLRPDAGSRALRAGSAHYPDAGSDPPDRAASIDRSYDPQTSGVRGPVSIEWRLPIAGCSAIELTQASLPPITQSLVEVSSSLDGPPLSPLPPFMLNRGTRRPVPQLTSFRVGLAQPVAT